MNLFLEVGRFRFSLRDCVSGAGWMSVEHDSTDICSGLPTGFHHFLSVLPGAVDLSGILPRG